MTAVETVGQRAPRSAALDPTSITDPDTETLPRPGGSSSLVVPRLRRERARTRPGLSLLRVVAPVSLLSLWWLGTRTGRINEQTFASPGTVWSAFQELLTSGELWANLSVSLARSLTGLAIGVAIGLLLGALAGLHRVADGLVDPLLQMAYTVPFLAVAPLLVVWFGIGEQPKIILIAVATCLPVYLNTHSGVRAADPKVVEAARVFGVSRARLIGQVVLPSAIPAILVGLRMALTLSIIALIVVEQTNAPKGIGFLMLSAQQYFQTDVLIVCILLYASFGLAAGGFVRGLGWLLQPWSRKANVR